MLVPSELRDEENGLLPRLKAGERIERQGAFLGLDAQQEVAREIHAAHRQSAFARHMQVEDPQRHRETLAPFRHRQDVGVLRILLREQVACQAQVARHGFRDGLLGALLLQALRQVVDTGGAQVAGALRVAAGVLVDGAGDGGLQQREVAVGGRAGLQ